MTIGGVAMLILMAAPNGASAGRNDCNDD